jgi:polysaccharide pyruvyl transferase WcaK-like protein
VRPTLRLLLDPGTYTCTNMGDVAMLQVAIARLRERSPGVRLQVFTDDAVALQRHCPGVEPVSHAGRLTWFDDQQLWGRIRGWMSNRPWGAIADAQRRWRLRRPELYQRALSFKLALHRRSYTQVDAFLAALWACDGLVAVGQGTLADAGEGHAAQLLATVETVLRLGKPVVLMGQGIGPIGDPALLARARDVLPGVSLVALRESRLGHPLLTGLGVPESRIVITGDDAIEPALRAAPEGLGQEVGLHLRVAAHAVRDTKMVEQVREVLQGFVRRQEVGVVPLPISHHRVGSYDPGTIRQVLAGIDDTSDGGTHTDTPAAVIQAAGRCRTVVTGAYHAAVFALAQGVPTICLGRSEYYLAKFHGLRDQFGAGCTPVRLDTALKSELTLALEAAWSGAESGRSALLRSAERQVALSCQAYDRAIRLFAATPEEASTGEVVPGALRQPELSS